jgi:hypothetical protein
MAANRANSANANRVFTLRAVRHLGFLASEAFQQPQLKRISRTKSKEKWQESFRPMTLEDSLSPRAEIQHRYSTHKFTPVLGNRGENKMASTHYQNAAQCLSGNLNLLADPSESKFENRLRDLGANLSWIQKLLPVSVDLAV